MFKKENLIIGLGVFVVSVVMFCYSYLLWPPVTFFPVFRFFVAGVFLGFVVPLLPAIFFPDAFLINRRLLVSYFMLALPIGVLAFVAGDTMYLGWVGLVSIFVYATLGLCLALFSLYVFQLMFQGWRITRKTQDSS